MNLLTTLVRVRTAFVPAMTRMQPDLANQGINKIWKGFIVTSDNKMEQAYVKKIKDINELYREIICSVLGKVLGISTPEPLVVKVCLNHPDIPSIDGQLFFGTVDCESPSFSRFIQDSNLYEEEILKYEDLHKIICFDEFIGNFDRHFGNVLFNGHTYNFIDHGYSFSTDLSYNVPLKECIWGTNQLADIFADRYGHNDVKIRNMLKKVRKFIDQSLSQEKLFFIDQISDIDLNDLNNHHKSLKLFLSKRLPLLIHHVACSLTNIDESHQLSLISY